MSDHRKRNKHIISNKKAFSSIVGAIFAILVIVSLTGTFFVWSLGQNTRYAQSVSEINQLATDQQSESINVTSRPIYTVGGGNVSVVVGIQNDGPISVFIKTLWVQDINKNVYGYLDLSSQNITLSPGMAYPINKNVTLIGSPNSNDLFIGWLITGRGSIIHLYPNHESGPQGPKGIDGSNIAETALVAQGIGAISMDFKSYRSYVVSGSTMGPGSSNYVVTTGANLAFSINVTNKDPTSTSINLTSYSLFWAFSPPVGGGAIKGEGWRIAKVTGNQITTAGINDHFILPYNVTTTLYFGPDLVSNSNLQPGGIAVNLLLTGKLMNGTSIMMDYGQNLPFISLIVQ